MSKLAKALTAAAGNAGESLYVEDVFSTYLYDGTGAAKTITNGIDLAGEGGLVWLKDRFSASLGFHMIYDTENGTGPDGGRIFNGTAGTNGTSTQADGLQSFNSDGFSLGTNIYENGSGKDYASWTFRKAEKFFDVVTYTGNGVAGRTVSHNLGSVPACIIVKLTSGSGGWIVYHVGTDATNPEQKYLQLNSTNAVADQTWPWNDTAPTDTEFTVGTGGNINANGSTYVAYLFASDAGGFGDDGDESIIKCGSYTASTGAEVDLGFEPQWILTKSASGTGDWYVTDNMRGWGADRGSNDSWLIANTSGAEFTSTNSLGLTPTGFTSFNGGNQTYIYIAIRRPMKTPESGTEVFKPSFRITGDPTVDTGFVTDMGIVATRTGGGTSDYHLIGSRLTGNLGMTTTSTSAEVTRGLEPLKWDYNNGWGGSDTASSFAVWYSFKRATGFFDVVAYTGTGGFRVLPHNLGAAPELIIGKRRNLSTGWSIASDFAGSNGWSYLTFNNGAEQVYQYSSILSSPPTSTSLYFWSGDFNDSSANHIAYLFASLAGVSKVGSYTGTGADLNVDCGFSAGARFVLIKRTDSTGDWYVWDSVRGIVAGNDPYLLLNSTAAEVTSTDYIDPLASGFRVTSSAPAALNASGGTYIFLAIA